LAQFRNEPLTFLESQVFRAVPKAIEAVGFKLFYYHAHSEQWQPVWQYLAAQPELKVIHIRRDNLLKVHLSRKRAASTNVWLDAGGTRIQYPPITLDYDECLRDFIQTRKWEQQGALAFCSQAVLDVHYETLVRNNDQELERVQNFLGVGLETLKPKTYQQSGQRLSASITNYHELKELFRGSEWEVFFEE
jgi:hypothetical protein